MDGLLYIIEQSINELSTVNQIIADYFLKNASDIIKMTTTQLAQELMISKASITRFCQHFGLAGFNDLKIVLSQQLVKYKSPSFTDIESESFKKDVSGNFLKQYFAVLSDTHEVLSQEKVMAAAELMYNSHTIMCTGVGSSDLIAQDLMHKLLRIQKKVVVYPEHDLRKISLLQMTKDDLLIAISYSGKKRETLELAKLANKLGIPVISVTRVGETPLSQMAVISFEGAAFENEYRTSAFGSRIALLYIVDVLFYTYSLCFDKESFTKLRLTYDTINS